MADVVVLKTGRLYEADMLSQMLEQHAIPHYRGMENFAGVRMAMPALPAQGPGTFFTVIVPESAADDARTILNELPVSREQQGLWSFNPRPWAKKVIIVYAWLALAGLAIGALINIIDWIGEL